MAMAAFKDLTGQRFGRLVAIERSDNNKSGEVMWRCKCDCGREIVTFSNSLAHGKVKTCGCSRVRDLTGRRFGRLLAISRVDNQKDRNSLWLCKCDCGNEKNVVSFSLVSGRTKSCGCLNLEFLNEMTRDQAYERYFFAKLEKEEAENA